MNLDIENYYILYKYPEGLTERERKRRKISDGKKSRIKLIVGNITGNTVSSQRWFVHSRVQYCEFVNYRLLFYLTFTRKPSHRRISVLPGGFKQSQKSWVGRDFSLFLSFLPGPVPIFFSFHYLFVLSDNLLDFL